jgi:5-methylcytosine-specific restriction protein B
MSYYNELKKFITVADKQVTGQGTVGVQEFNQERGLIYNDLKVETKFGTGRASAIPWIAFLSENDTVQNGIYPVYLYYKEKNILILAYGVSETKEPNRTWNLQKGIKINEYFLNNYSKNAEKYGDSFVYKVYDLKKKMEEKEVNEDLDALIAIYKSTILKSKVIQEEQAFKNLTSKKRFSNQIPFDIKTFQAKTLESGLIFSQQIIQRFVASLCTKPFVICSGLSGSGKTKLAQAFVQWICESDKQYKIIPVGADWTNREPLLGYPNGLDPLSYVTPDSGALQLIIEALKEENQNKPYFMILDEMNLSHVERYFADFLSIMESGDSIKLYSGADRKDSSGKNIEKEINWPKNLFIIGTVNIDETTYMFSPKVLDRANVIEFRITSEDMNKFFKERKELNMKELFLDKEKSKGGAGKNMGEDFFKLAADKTISKIPEIEGDNNVLNAFFNELQIVGSEFGYRSATEIELLITKLGINGFIDEQGQALNNNTKIDIAIMQKLLPKLHGSRNKLSKVLPVLGGFCLEENSKIKEDYLDKFLNNSLTEVELKVDPNIKYKISFEKICRMYKNAIENGFASYAEA